MIPQIDDLSLLHADRLVGCDDGRATLRAVVLDQLLDKLDSVRIKPVQWLIQQPVEGVLGNKPGQGSALALAGGEVPYRHIQQVGQAQAVEVDLLTSVDGAPEAQRFPKRKTFVQCGLLVHQTDRPPPLHRTQAGGPIRQFRRRWAEQSCEHANEGRFADAVGAYQVYRPARIDLQIKRAEQLPVPPAAKQLPC